MTPNPERNESIGAKEVKPVPTVFRMLHGFERWLRAQSLHPAHKIYPSELFPWIPHLEAHWHEIRKELDQVLNTPERIPPFQEINWEQHSVTRDQRWRTYFLYAYGHEVPAHCRECPNTARLLRTIPGMKTGMFSILAPGKRIPMHRGPYGGVLRFQLGLKIPDGPERCGIEVGGLASGWREGKALVFDDTYQHWAWNDTDEHRAVLFVDFLRPLRPVAAAVNKALIHGVAHSPYGKLAIQRFKSWYEERGIDLEA